MRPDFALSLVGFALGMAAGTGQACGQAAASSLPFTQLSAQAAVIVVQVGALQPAEGCKAPPTIPLFMFCPQSGTVEVTRILKGSFPQTPITFEVTFPTAGGFRSAQDRGWRMIFPVPGKGKYLITSFKERELRDLVTSPDAARGIDEKADVVGDVELILKCQTMSIPDQVSAVAAAIVSGGKSRSSFLSDYIGELLRVGSDVDLATLSQVIEGAGETEFASEAKYGLLYTLSNDQRVLHATPGRLWPLFVMLTARYLILPDSPTEGESDFPRYLVRHIVETIRNSPEAESQFGAALDALLNDQRHPLTISERDRVKLWRGWLEPR
jgi:hypothetical protein